MREKLRDFLYILLLINCLLTKQFYQNVLAFIGDFLIPSLLLLFISCQFSFLSHLIINLYHYGLKDSYFIQWVNL